MMNTVRTVSSKTSVGSIQMRAMQTTRAAAGMAERVEETNSDATAEVPIPREKTLMSNSEAFVETMRSQGVKDMFGIVGSAFMDALDIFPSAGIRFISVAHEQNAAHMADGYARVSGKHGVCIGQNGPGITNCVTGIGAAFWAHSPVVMITPECGTLTKGHGGFQEVDQLPIFETVTKYQAHVNHPARMAEYTNRAFDYAMMERGPTQLNIPRDYFYGENEVAIPKPNVVEKSAGGPQALADAAELIKNAKNPVILAGGGVVMSEGGQDAVRELAEFLQCPVATTYLHNDAFPASHPLMCGPLGYQGHKTAMHSMKEADLVIAMGTRLGPFGTLPQYGMEYWPQNAKIVQVDADARKLGLVREVDVSVNGDAALASRDLLARLIEAGNVAALDSTEARLARLAEHRASWEAELDDMTYNCNYEIPEGRMRPRAMLRELEKAMPRDAMVATDIGNICSVSNSYLRFEQPQSFLAAMTFGNCGYAFPTAMGAKVARPDRPAVAYVGDGAWGMSLNEVLTCVREDIPTTAVVFNNGQWGAEKKNQVLWFGDRYVGSQLDHRGVANFSEISRSMGGEGIRVTSLDEVGDALRMAVANQTEGKTTVLEMMVTKELGDPFRRDAMKLPIRRLAQYKHTDRFEESSTGQPTDLLL